METKLVRIERDERFPDYDVIFDNPLSWEVLVEMSEKDYNKARKIIDAYDQLQIYLDELYAKAKKTNS